MARPKLPKNPWLRGVLIGAGVLVVGGVALGGHDNGGATPTVPAGNVSTLTTDPVYTTVPTSTAVVPLPVPAATTEALAPQQGSVTTGGSGGSETSCGSDSYVNVDGQCVHDPVQAPAAAAPSGATAQCEDGTYSFSKHHSGTCSGHGGVAEWLS